MCDGFVFNVLMIVAPEESQPMCADQRVAYRVLLGPDGLPLTVVCYPASAFLNADGFPLAS